MTDLLEAIARVDGDRVAHVWRDRRTTYGELAARSDALAHELRATVPRGTPVVVYGHKEPGMLVGFLACMKAGNPYVPVDSGLPAARIAKIIAHCRPGRTIDAALLDGPVSRVARPADPVRPDEVVYIMYTSGSTGDPKGVQVTLANLTGFVAWAGAVHPVGGGLRFLNQAPFSFDLSAMDLYLALTSGGTLHAVDRAMVENPLELRLALAAADVHVWVSTPSFAEMCLADRRFDARLLPSLRCMLFCGEILAPSCVARLHARFPQVRVYNTYGPTEATVAVTSVLVDSALLAAHPKVLPLGAPMPGTELLVVGTDGVPVAPGASGELVIVGPCVARGYLHGREFGGRYATGDAARYEGDALLFEGRLDHQVKLFGHRIELEDVAHNLAALPGVDAAVVLPVEEDGRCVALAAFVISDVSPAAIRTALAERVPRYMVPRDIVCRASLPMTVNGKIDRKRLAGELRGTAV